MFVVMRLVKDCELNTGQTVTFCNQGCEGMLPVFGKVEDAREAYGEEVRLLEIGVGEDP
jgi:hypothetical protein